MGNQSCSMQGSSYDQAVTEGFRPHHDDKFASEKEVSEDTRCSERSISDFDVSTFDLPLKKVRSLESFSTYTEESSKFSSRNEHIQKVSTQMFLRLDEEWISNLESIPKDKIQLQKIYKEVRVDGQPSSGKVFLKRIGQKGRRMNLLFKDNIPTTGVHFFEVDLASFSPIHKLEFKVGVMEYDYAKYDPSNQHSWEHSYTIPSNKFSVNKNDDKEVNLSQKIRVEICREEGFSYIAFYVNGKLQKIEDLKPEFTDDSDAMKLVPYIQTRFEGVTFGWKNPSGKPWLPKVQSAM